MKKAVLSTLLSTLVLLAAAPGIRPRAAANSYPEHSEQTDFSICAFLIPSIVYQQQSIQLVEGFGCGFAQNPVIVIHGE